MLGIAVYVAPPNSAAGRVAGVLLSVILIVWAVLMYAYERVDTVRLWTGRVTGWITNREITYSISATLEVDDSHLALKSVDEHVSPYLGPKDVQIAQDGRSTAWTIRGVVFRVTRDDMFDGTPVVVAEWLQAPRGFRFWSNFLDLTAIPLLEQVSQDPQVSKRKFTAQVHFEDINPYFGALVAHRAYDTVDSFRIRTHVFVGSEHVSVDVEQDRMQVVGFGLRAVHATSARYLGLNSATGGAQ